VDANAPALARVHGADSRRAGARACGKLAMPRTPGRAKCNSEQTTLADHLHNELVLTKKMSKEAGAPTLSTNQ
jgi:hypothetical protein